MADYYHEQELEFDEENNEILSRSVELRISETEPMQDPDMWISDPLTVTEMPPGRVIGASPGEAGRRALQ